MGQLKKIVDYFFHHEYSDEIVERVHARLVRNDDKEERDEALKKIWDELDEMVCPKEEGLKAYAALEQKIQPKASSSPYFLMKRYVRIAALWVIPLISVSAALYFITEAQKIEQAIERVTFVEHYVNAGKRELVTLPDSSKVWLNSNTLLIYPSTFYRNQREVYLSGEGYFDIQPNKESPFTVRTNTLNIQVLGTKFDVSTYPNAERVSATLETGSINVTIKDKEQSYILIPNERIAFAPASGEVSITQVKVENYINWKEGGLLFKDDSFETVIRTLERIYNVKVHLRTSAYSKNSLTIRFKQNEMLENVLALIKEVIPEFSFRIEDTNIYIE